MGQEKYVFSEAVKLEEIQSSERFWNYFLTYAFGQKNKEKEENRLREYMVEHYPLDEEWIKAFTTCNPIVKISDSVTLKTMQFSKKGYRICFYADRIGYTGTIYEPKREKLSRRNLKGFLKSTKRYTDLQRFLMCPTVSVDEREEREFRKIVRAGLEQTTLLREDLDFVEQLIVECCMITEEESEDKALGRAMLWWFLGLGALFLIGTKMRVNIPNRSWVGEDGLYRLIRYGIEPEAIYMLLGMIAFVIHMNYSTRKSEKKRKLSKQESGRGVAIAITIFMLPILIVWIRVGYRDISRGYKAMLDLKDLQSVESIVLEEPTVKIRKRHRGRGSGMPNYYELKADNLEKSFRIPPTEQAYDAIEKHADEEIIVYYYKNSYILKKACCGDEILIGE